MRNSRLLCLWLCLFVVLHTWSVSVCNPQDSVHLYTMLAGDAERNTERDSLLQKALKFAVEPNHDRAMLLRLSANNAFKIGQSERAQQEQIEAYTIFMRLQEWDWASMCLYERSIDYLNICDWENVEQQLESLRALLRYDSPIVRYNYYSIASLYAMQDSLPQAIAYGRQAIGAMEQIPYPEHYQILPVWNYYNMAYMFDALCTPPPVDSIEHYLQRAEQAVNPAGDWVDIEEANISIMDMRAWLCYYRRDYRTAEQLMQQVLVKIDSVAMDSPNTVITERGEAYRFLAMLHEEQGHWRTAFRYQQLLNDNNLLRYDIEKNTALQEIETRYEVERKQLEMERLEAKNSAFLWLLVVCVLVILSGGLLLAVVVLRKRRAEDRLYQAALEQENIRSMLSDMMARTDTDPVMLIKQDLTATFRQLTENTPYREEAIQAVQQVDNVRIANLFRQAPQLTAMDKRYIVCFEARLTVEQIAVLFRIAPASVYTVRYRMRKKFPASIPFPY